MTGNPFVTVTTTDGNTLFPQPKISIKTLHFKGPENTMVKYTLAAVVKDGSDIINLLTGVKDQENATERKSSSCRLK